MQHIAVGDLGKKLGTGDAFGVGIVNPIDAGGFQDYVGLDFHGAEGGSGVGGKVGIAGAGGNDDDASFFQVAESATANEGLGNFVHFNGALNTSVNSGLFQGVLQGQGIHHGGQHAHVIAGGAVDLKALLAATAKNVPAADHDSHLNAQGLYVFQFGGDGMDGFAV